MGEVLIGAFAVCLVISWVEEFIWSLGRIKGFVALLMCGLSDWLQGYPSLQSLGVRIFASTFLTLVILQFVNRPVEFNYAARRNKQSNLPGRIPPL